MARLEISIDGDGIALICPREIEGARFDSALTGELGGLVARIATEKGIRGAVLASSRSGGFFPAGDLGELAGLHGLPVREIHERRAALSGVLRQMERCGKPLACAIGGAALGPGLELALAGHFRVMADDAATVLGLPDIRYGVIPGAGGTQRLPRLIGIPAALRILLSGETVASARALELGIVDELRPRDQIVARAREWVLANAGAQARWDVKGFKVPGGVGCLAPHAIESFQAGTSRQARATNRNDPAPLALLAAVFEGTQVPLDVGLRIESKYHAKVLASPVARNLIRTNAVYRPAAERLSCRPRGVEPFAVKRLGVLGAGMMGAGIANVAAARGIDVVLLDSSADLARKGKDRTAAVLQGEVGKGRLAESERARILERIEVTEEYGALKGCDLVIEAVFERRDVKRDVTREAAAVMPSHSVFASNTSTLPITGLAEAFPDPARFIGLHFFSPVERMPLVEVILGAKTGEATLARALDFVRQLRKTPVVVHDSPGFFTSRVFGAYVDEGMAMLAEGVAPALIENAARLCGMPVGPLAVCDEVSIDLQLKVHEQAVADGLPDRFRRLTAIEVVKTMVGELKRPGRRAGAGFYEYPPGGRKRLWSGLSAVFPAAALQPSVEEVRRRLLHIQAMESARCMEEGVIAHPEDADIASVLGIGFPAWTGGALSYIDTVGVAKFAEECERLAERHGERFRPSVALLERAREGRSYHPSAA